MQVKEASTVLTLSWTLTLTYPLQRLVFVRVTFSSFIVSTNPISNYMMHFLQALTFIQTLAMCTHCFCGRPPTWVYNRQRYSLFLFSPRNRFRVVCRKLTSSKWFDYSILLFIFANCITIAMERPTLAEGSAERKLLNISNHIFTLVFFVEMNVKVLALGFYCGSDAYLR